MPLFSTEVVRQDHGPIETCVVLLLSRRFADCRRDDQCDSLSIVWKRTYPLHIRVGIPAVVQNTAIVMFHSVFPIEKSILGREVVSSARRADATGSTPRLEHPQGKERVSLSR